jgi:SAM-dependent methyltransferase
MFAFASKHGYTKARKDSIQAYFEAYSEYWTDVYQRSDIEGAVYKERRSAVLELARKLALPLHSSILEIGCGSGFTSVQLARQGYTVHAVDSSEAMIRSTRRHAEQAGVNEQVLTGRADAENLGFPDNSFDLVLKIGVAPWLSSLDTAIRHVVRVLRPGGYLIITADNWWRLNHWLDPRFFPPLGPMRRRIRVIFEQFRIARPPGASARLHSIGEFDRSLLTAGLQKIETRTVGFGPFTFLGCKVVPDCFAVRLHQQLQHLANRRVPVIRSMGTQYIVLARKPVM